MIARLRTSRGGLTSAEAERRLAEAGPNLLPRARPVSALRIFVNQLASMVVVLLGAAALVALGLGDHVEAAAIAAVLVVNTAIGFTIDLRARRAMDALLHLAVPRATVVRDGRPRVIEASDIVPGDVIELSAGQAVPADGRLIGGTEFRTAEAALTGESMSVSKHADRQLEPDTLLPDRLNMVYAGTTVEAGAGRAVVTATGAATELGRIGTLVAGLESEPTPLERRLDVLGRRLAWLALGIAGGRRRPRGAPRRTDRSRDRNGHRAGCRGGSGSAPGRGHDRAGGRAPENGAAARAGAASTFGRDARIDHDHLHGQDAHPHLRRHERRARVDA